MSVFQDAPSEENVPASPGRDVGEDSSAIDGVDLVSIQQRGNRRIRKIDWLKILDICDRAAEEEPGKWAKVGVLDRSVRTHIASGRYSYIDPTKYEVTTRKNDEPGASKSSGYLFMRRRVENSEEN